jgi:hypothetical protein
MCICTCVYICLLYLHLSHVFAHSTTVMRMQGCPQMVRKRAQGACTRPDEAVTVILSSEIFIDFKYIVRWRGAYEV